MSVLEDSDKFIKLYSEKIVCYDGNYNEITGDVLRFYKFLKSVIDSTHGRLFKSNFQLERLHLTLPIDKFRMLARVLDVIIELPIEELTFSALNKNISNSVLKLTVSSERCILKKNKEPGITLKGSESYFFDFKDFKEIFLKARDQIFKFCFQKLSAACTELPTDRDASPSGKSYDLIQVLRLAITIIYDFVEVDSNLDELQFSELYNQQNDILTLLKQQAPFLKDHGLDKVSYLAEIISGTKQKLSELAEMPVSTEISEVIAEIDKNKDIKPAAKTEKKISALIDNVVDLRAIVSRIESSTAKNFKSINNRIDNIEAHNKLIELSMEQNFKSMNDRIDGIENHNKFVEQSMKESSKAINESLISMNNCLDRICKRINLSKSSPNASKEAPVSREATGKVQEARSDSAGSPKDSAGSPVLPDLDKISNHVDLNKNYPSAPEETSVLGETTDKVQDASSDSVRSPKGNIGSPILPGPTLFQI